MISAGVFRAILLAAVTSVLVGATASGSIAGRVTDAEGNPLADVRVMSLPWGDSKTDSDGRFALKKPAQLIRFSKSGYGPVTVPAGADRLDIVLQQSTQSVWSPPTCSPDRVRRFGDTMMFTAPPGVRLYTTTDNHYRTVAIRSLDSTLQFGTGPHWTYGLPLAQVLEAMVLIHERDVHMPRGEPGAEYRGVRRDGGHWRAVYLFGQSIGYDEADVIAAKYFDGIIDSLCFNG
jgi:hypothetical protein